MAAAAGKAVKAAKTSTFLGVAGCILAGGISFAEARREARTEQTGVVWRQQNNGAWVQVTGNYTCTGTANICTRTYEMGHNPNTDGEDEGIISQRAGTFQALP